MSTCLVSVSKGPIKAWNSQASMNLGKSVYDVLEVWSDNDPAPTLEKQRLLCSSSAGSCKSRIRQIVVES